MTALIVGCGYLGLRVARRLIDQGSRVIGTVRTPANAEKLQSLGIEPLLLDVSDAVAFEHLPAVDHILWCVGFDRLGGVPIRTVYVDGLRRFLSRLPAFCGRFVYTSSTGVYGQVEGEWVTEESATQPPNDSAQACLDAEHLLTEFAEHSALSPVILRLAGLYGPGRLIRRAAVERGEPIPGDPEHWLNLVHVDDAASVADHALSNPTPSTLYNVSDDRPVQRREFYQELARLRNAPDPRFAMVSEPRKGRDAVNKRVSNRRLRAEIPVTLFYPDFQAGLRASLDG